MKTACIYHSVDLDGWMSAAIVKYWFISNNKNYSISDISSQQEILDKGKFSVGNGIIDLSSNDKIEFLDFIGYNYGQPIPDLSNYDKVIMVDVSFPKEEMFRLYDRLDDNFIFIDHHKSSIFDSYEGGYKTCDGKRNIKYAACELTWKYFFPNESMPEIVRLLGRYDCFGHKGTDEEQKIIDFQYGARQCITNYEEAYKELQKYFDDCYTINAIQYQGKVIYQYLCTEAKQAYKNGFEIELNIYNPVETEKYREIDWKDTGQYRFIAINRERFNPTNFGIDYTKDGYEGTAAFYFDGEKYHFSIYSTTVDCSLIAKGYGGGGHKGASGFILSIEQFNSLIKQ